MKQAKAKHAWVCVRNDAGVAVRGFVRVRLIRTAGEYGITESKQKKIERAITHLPTGLRVCASCDIDDETALLEKLSMLPPFDLRNYDERFPAVMALVNAAGPVWRAS